MTDITILIDQSYFIQNNPETKSVEERSQEFMEKFLEAKNKSLMLRTLSTKDRNEILPKFLFESLYLNTFDPNEFPIAKKLDNFIINSIKKELDSKEEEVAPNEERKEQELPQGPEEVKDSLEEGERGEGEEEFEGTINPGNEGNNGEDENNNENERSPAEIEEGNTRRLDSSVEIQDGESTTIRRDPSGPVNRFF